jgi:hypothetical protein
MMRSKLVLTLWLLGAVLYAGSTVFLAHAVLGIGANVSPVDKGKTTLAASSAAQCEKDTLAAADTKDADKAGDVTPAKEASAEPDKTAAADPQKTAAIEPKTPTPAPSAVKPAAPQASRPQPSTPSAGAEPEPGDRQLAEQDSPPGDPQHQVLGPDGAPVPDGWQNQDAMGRGAPGGPGAAEGAPGEEEEWARVVAGTADMRSEPSMQAPLVYALPAGWQVRVVARQPGWVQVQDANSGAAGWVESSALAPTSGPTGPQGAPRYGNNGYAPSPGPYGPYGRYAEEGPYGAPPPPPAWRGRRYGSEFGDFFRRALGGF